MYGELDIFGVYIPTILALAMAAYLVNLMLRRVLARTGLYRIVWHRALFDVSLYVLVLCALCALANGYSQ